MGWRTVATFKFDEASYLLRTDRLEDPWKDWKDARLRTYHQRKWFYVVGVLGFAALLWGAVRKRTPWEAAALSAIMIAAIPELTCYYYSFLIVMALLWSRRAEAGMALLAVTAGTGFADMAPTQYLPSQGLFWSRINHLMPTWLAEQYTLMSAITLAGLVYILYEFGFSQRATLVPVPVWEIGPAPAGPAPTGKGGEKSAAAEKGTSAGSQARAAGDEQRDRRRRRSAERRRRTTNATLRGWRGRRHSRASSDRVEAVHRGPSRHATAGRSLSARAAERARAGCVARRTDETRAVVWSEAAEVLGPHGVALAAALLLRSRLSLAFGRTLLHGLCHGLPGSGFDRLLGGLGRLLLLGGGGRLFLAAAAAFFLRF